MGSYETDQMFRRIVLKIGPFHSTKGIVNGRRNKDFDHKLCHSNKENANGKRISLSVISLPATARKMQSKYC